MSTEGGWKLPEVVPLKKRLLYWFAVYLGFQLPLIMWWPCFFNYPWGLAPYLAFISGAHDQAPLRPLGLLFYVLHFIATMILPGKKAFTALMIILIIVASLNTVSCMKTLGPNWYKGLPKIEGSTTIPLTHVV